MPREIGYDGLLAAQNNHSMKPPDEFTRILYKVDESGGDLGDRVHPSSIHLSKKHHHDAKNPTC
jgi:hypothetical protein